jgi:hypothetical protein
MSQGFYRVGAERELMAAPNGLSSPTGTYVPAKHATYTYPIDGQWRWFDSEQSALIYFVNEISGDVPAFVTPYQAREALVAAGLFTQADTMVNLAGGSIKMAWEYSVVIERASPFIATMQKALGLTNEQIDDLFRAASLIK